MTRAKPPSPTCCSMRQQKLWIWAVHPQGGGGDLGGEGIELQAVEVEESFVHEGFLWVLGFGQIGRRQSGGGVLLDELLEQRRHARRAGAARSDPSAEALGARWPSAFLFLSTRIEAAEDGAGFGIGQIDRAQVPGSVAQPELLQVAVAGGDFKANAFQAEGAIAAALGARRTSVVKASWSCSVAGQGRPTSLSLRKRCKGVWPISEWTLRLYSSSTQGWVASLSWSRVRSATPSSIGRSRPSIWPQKDSCLPF